MLLLQEAPTKETKELEGYIHCLSPVKDTINKRAKFFDFKVQLREQIVRGVCFSPEKKEKLKQFQKCKSPIKIRKYGQNHKYGARNIVIDKRTQVILSAGPLSFACVDLDSDKSIGSLKKVAPNQTVTIKGKVVSLYGRKKISGKNLSKQEGMIADSSDTIKVVLWESFIDSVEEGKTYEFINFTYKVDKYGIYIGSSRNGSCVKEVEGVEGPVAECVVDERELAEREIECTVLGVSDATKYYSCRNCKKKIESDGKLGHCSCGMSQKISAANIQWVVKLFVEESEGKAFHLTAFHAAVRQLMAKCGRKSLLNEMSPLELKTFLLSLDEIKVVYNCTNNSIKEVL